MDKAQLISEVKQLLGNAEMDKAFNRLAEFLVSDPKYRELHNLALQARDISAKLTARLSKPDKAALWRIMAVLEDSAVDENS